MLLKTLLLIRCENLRQFGPTVREEKLVESRKKAKHGRFTEFFCLCCFSLGGGDFMGTAGVLQQSKVSDPRLCARHQ